MVTTHAQSSQHPTNVTGTYLHHSPPHLPVVPLPQHNIIPRNQPLVYIPPQVQNQFDPFAMISVSPPTCSQPTPGSLPPPPPSVSDVGPHPGLVGPGQGRSEGQADRDQVLQEFEFENDSTGQSENLSSQ